MTIVRTLAAVAVCAGLVFVSGCSMFGGGSDAPEAGVCACGGTCECPAHEGGVCTCGEAAAPDAPEGGTPTETAVLCTCGDACSCAAKTTPGTACACGGGAAGT